jgi:hypothetical protein
VAIFTVEGAQTTRLITDVQSVLHAPAAAPAHALPVCAPSVKLRAVMWGAAMGEPNIVPFGKYRGQPIERLAGDKEYIDWLSAQPWFRERYASLYTIIINHFSPASDDTPEHNALQALFLEAQFCTQFLAAARPSWWVKEAEFTRRNLETPPTTAEYRSLAEIYATAASGTATIEYRSRPQFEVGGVDVTLEIEAFILPMRQPERNTPSVKTSAKIEIKPTVGDDYPSILRQVKALKADTVFLESYVGSGITEQQFIALFRNERIAIVFHRDIAERLC